MTDLYKGIGAFIAAVESESEKHWVAAELLERQLANPSERPAGCSLYKIKASAANARGNAAAYRNMVHWMRNVVIGEDLRSAKPLEECR